MNVGAALTRALLATLAAPATWPLGLAVFLLRGGLLLVVLPIVVLPSPVGLGNFLAPTLMSVVFQGLSIEVVAILSVAVLAIVTWVVVGGLVAASLEAEAARIVAAGDIATDGGATRVGPGPVTPHRSVAVRILVARLIAHLPTGVASLWGSVRLVDVAYRELTSPDDVTSPIVLRVLAGAPEVTVALVVAWALGELTGGLATRRIVLDGSPTAAALRDAVMVATRRPLGLFAGFVVPLAGLVLVVLPSTIAASIAWSAVRVAMRSPGELVFGTLAVMLFVSVWILGLLLIGVMTAWRGAVWSVAYGDLWPRPGRPGARAPG